MHVSVAIVGFRNIGDIQRCLAALDLCDYRDFEVVICENGGPSSCNDLRNAIARYLAGGRSIRLIEAPGNVGYAGGVNICMAASPEADAWWILNPDTEPYVGAMSALVERLKQGADAVGGPLYLPDGRVQSYGGRWRSWIARAESIGYGSASEVSPDAGWVENRQNYLNGASMMVSRHFWSTVGPMRESFFLYCEEIDWCIRACASGMRLGFAGGGGVLHEQGTTTGKSADLRSRSRLAIYLDERNKMLLTRDHFPARLPVAAVSAVALLGLRYLRKGAFKQFGYGVSGWFAGLGGQRGLPPWMTSARG